jgi:chemosensory pili system protein ChpA (sensor histidine kinase/response regulator)
VFGESVDDVATLHQTALSGLDDAGRDLSLQARAMRAVQHDLMRIRMIRFGSITDRLYRVVRQAAKEVGKRVHLEVQGGQAELDRGVLERLVGPLEHLLRNAVSHGIEPVAQRKALGKPDAGAITVSVRQEGDTVVLSVADDGAGLNLEHIRARARALQLIGPDSRPSDAELTRYIFAPGFSTASAVSELAGRGVGLDAVRADVAAMGGRIEVDARAGEGACFTASLPVSLAASHVVLLSAGGTRVAVPSGLVEQVLQFRPEVLEQSIREGSLVVAQGEAAPLYQLSTLLERPDAPPILQRFTPVALLRSGTDRIAVIADRITPSQEVVVKQVGPQLARLTGMAGATVLDNGDVVLILDLVQIAATGRVQPVGRETDREGPARAFARSPVVMVVDDSVTVRKVTERLLVRQGFSVMLARDGVDALRQASETPPALMLLDIEMPRMDGFEVLARMQANAALATIPVVMISSRTSARHREQALAMGVEALLGKPWTEAEMLELVHRLTSQAMAR